MPAAAIRSEDTMNAVTALSKPTKLDEFRMQILPPDKRHEMVVGMPKHVNADRFERNLVNALMQNPDLMQCDPRLIFREISKAAALGLYLDPQLGEAYLIVGWNGKRKAKEPQLRIGYRGLIKLGRQSGEISQIYAHEVHQNDVFKASLGDEKKLVHEPDIFGERGSIVGYYAVVKYKDGDTDFEPLTIAQAHAIRDRSDGWRAFKDGKIKSTPWSTDEVEMSKKTAIRRLVKRIPQSPERADAIKIEDAAENHEFAQAALAPPPRPPVPPSLQPPPVPPEQPSDIEDVYGDGGETQTDDGDVVDDDSQTFNEDQADSSEQQENQTATDSAQTDFDTASWLQRLEENLAKCTNAEEIVEAWNEADALATLEGDDDAIAVAKSYKRKHTERVSKAK
jgi:recombination protein RecT